MRGRLHDDQSGMTLVEVLVAATILILGIGATLTALDGSRRLTLKSERVDQAVAIGQREVERMRSLPYASIGTTTMPTSTAQQPSLLDAVVSAGSLLQLKVTVPPSYEAFSPVVPASSGGLPLTSCIAPASVADSTACPTADRISSGPTRGTLYRYVTDVPTCTRALILDACTGVLGDVVLGKRTTVVVQLAGVNGDVPAPVRTDSVVASV